VPQNQRSRCVKGELRGRLRWNGSPAVESRITQKGLAVEAKHLSKRNIRWEKCRPNGSQDGGGGTPGKGQTSRSWPTRKGTPKLGGKGRSRPGNTGFQRGKAHSDQGSKSHKTKQKQRRMKTGY